MKNQYVRTALVLSLICAVAAVLLAYFNSITAPVIEEYELKAKLAAREAVSCGLSVGEEKAVNDGLIDLICPLKKGATTEGYVIEMHSNGYGGRLEITASFNTNGQIMAVKLGKNSETPGVGKRYENSENLRMFLNTEIPTSKKALSTEDSALVSGATVSFTGISKALSAGSNYVKSLKGAI